MSFYGNIYADPHLEFQLTPSQDSEDNGEICYDLILKTPNGVQVAATKIVLPTDNVVQKVEYLPPEGDNNQSLTLKFYIKDLDSSETAQTIVDIPFTKIITTDSLNDNAVTADKIIKDAILVNHLHPDTCEAIQTQTRTVITYHEDTKYLEFAVPTVNIKPQEET